jgi:exodeoxyribonuclease III
VRLITWNVARRIAVLPEQAAALASREPDVVALQEVTARGHGLWLRALERIGLPHVVYSPGPRMGVLLAAREPLAPVEPLPVPRPESTAAGAAGGIAFHTVHVPNAANGWVKIRTLEAVRAGLAAASGPRVLCGDLNTPRRELPDGTVLSFARDSRGRLRAERGTEWDDGELGVVPRLAELGFADAPASR